MQDEPGVGSAQTLRADARRNRDALVEAAAKVFAVAGVDAPIKDIADEAGVGVGTFYRRFPKRSDLIFAVLRYEVESCAGAAEILAAQYAPFEALTRWIDRFLDLVIAKRGLAAALQSDAPAYAALRGDFEARLVPSLQWSDGCRRRGDRCGNHGHGTLARDCAPRCQPPRLRILNNPGEWSVCSFVASASRTLSLNVGRVRCNARSTPLKAAPAGGPLASGLDHDKGRQYRHIPTTEGQSP